MANRIDTVKSRDALRPRHTPYWQRVRKGCYVGLRKTTAASSGAWLARYRDEETGKQIVRSLGRLEEVLPAERFDRAKASAEEWFTHKGMGGSTSAKTLRHACEDYVKALKEGRRVATAKDAEARFERWVYPKTAFCQAPLLKLNPRTIGEWRSELTATPAIHQDKAKRSDKARSPASVNRDMTCLRAALNLALENGYVTTDRAWKSKLKPIKDADGRRDVYLDLAQRRKLITSAATDLASLLRGLSQVPLRPGALAALDVDCFDERLSTLRIGKDNSGRDRRIPLPPSTARFFAALAKDRPSHAPLVPRADGSRWTKDAWKRPIKEAAAKAGLPDGTVAYALRHSAITDLIALHRLDTMTVAQLAGTSLLMIERNYGHLLRDHAKTALAGLAIDDQVPDRIGIELQGR
jgi:integrase